MLGKSQRLLESTNSVKLQAAKSVYKNQSCFCTLTIKYLKKQFKRILIYNSTKTIKYLSIN